MLRHRSLVVAKFVRVVSPSVLQRYFKRLAIAKKPAGWEELNGEALEAFLDRPENTEANTLIRNDFQRVNDIAEDGMGVVLRAYSKYGIDMDTELTSEENAFRLFLDYTRAFDFAWSRFLLYASSSQLSIYDIGVKDLAISDAAIDVFKADVRAWFAGQAKGEQCEVTHYDDEGERLILVRHGSYVKAQPLWAEQGLDVIAFRPALEDLVVYEPDTGLVRIKTTQTKDRDEYLRLFARHMVGNEQVAKRAAESDVYSLTPLQDGSFNFDGDGDIARVELKSVRMRIYGLTTSTVTIDSPDVQSALEHDLGGLSIDAGTILSARLKFWLLAGKGKLTHRTVTITPPASSRLAERADSETIVNYLRKSAVRRK